MVDITFDCGSSNSVVVTGQIVYGTKFNDERYNQHTLRSAEGTLITYDTGKNIVVGEIIIKAVSYINGELLRTWIQEKAIFRLNKFDVTVPDEVDLGEGKGENLSDVNFDSDTTKGVFIYRAPGIYIIKFPYTYVR